MALADRLVVLYSVLMGLIGAIIQGVVLASGPVAGAVSPPATGPASQPSVPTVVLETPTEPYRAPDRTIILQPGSTIDWFGCSNDGLVYAAVTLKQVHVPALLSRAWPELMVIVVGLPLLRRLWRIRRQPQIPGAEHCRQCNYALVGLTSDRCPECGAAINSGGRVPARSRWRRSRIPAELLLGVAILYTGAILRHWREVPLARKIPWRSHALATWALNSKLSWADPYLEEANLLIAIDPSRKYLQRVVMDLPAGEYLYFLSPDGQTLVQVEVEVEWRMGDLATVFEVRTQIDVRTGHTIRHYARGALPEMGLFPVFSPDSRRLMWVARGDVCRLVSLDLASGQWSSGPLLEGRNPALAATESRLVVAARSQQGFLLTSAELQSIDWATGRVLSQGTSGCPDPSATVLLFQAGPECVYLAPIGGGWVLEWDPVAAKPKRRIDTQAMPFYFMSSSGDGKLAAIVSLPVWSVTRQWGSGLAAYDVKTWKLLCGFWVPLDRCNVEFSRDGRFLIVRGTTPSTGQIVLAVFDLPWMPPGAQDQGR